VQLGINRMGQQLVNAASCHHITGEQQLQLGQGTLAIAGLLPPAWCQLGARLSPPSWGQRVAVNLQLPCIPW
jgi:hypothetical protein